MRGRRPKPTRLKVITGNPGKRPLNKNEPKPRPAVPDCLTDAAKAEWERISQELLSLRLLTSIDRAALAAYCQAWGRWVEAEEALKKHGVVVRSPNGFPIQSPYLAIANKALDQMRAMLTEFGMSPSSRSRVTAQLSPMPPEWDEFITEFGA